MDLDTIRTRTRRYANVFEAQLVSDAEVDASINEAYLELCGLEDWPFLHSTVTFPTVADTASYTLDASLRYVRGLYVTTFDEPRELRPRSQPPMDNQEADDPDEPNEYVLDDPTTIVLFPTPDAAYTVTVRGILDVAELSAGTDEPVFRAEYHPAVAYSAAVRLLEIEGDDSGRIERFLDETRSYVDRMRRDYLKQHDKRQMVMGGRWGGPRRYPVHGAPRTVL